MYAGLKYFTKDTDLVVRTEQEYNSCVEAMKRMGFRSIRPGAGYSRMNLSDMLEREDGYRIDIFNDRVCGKLRLSEGMVSRSKERVRHEGVILSSCSMEDILIFKSITEREGGSSGLQGDNHRNYGRLDDFSEGTGGADLNRRGCVDHMGRRQTVDPQRGGEIIHSCLGQDN